MQLHRWTSKLCFQDIVNRHQKTHNHVRGAAPAAGQIGRIRRASADLLVRLRKAQLQLGKPLTNVFAPPLYMRIAASECPRTQGFLRISPWFSCVSFGASCCEHACANSAAPTTPGTLHMLIVTQSAQPLFSTDAAMYQTLTTSMHSLTSRETPKCSCRKHGCFVSPENLCICGRQLCSLGLQSSFCSPSVTYC